MITCARLNAHCTPVNINVLRSISEKRKGSEEVCETKLRAKSPLKKTLCTKYDYVHMKPQNDKKKSSRRVNLLCVSTNVLTFYIWFKICVCNSSGFIAPSSSSLSLLSKQTVC